MRSRASDRARRTRETVGGALVGRQAQRPVPLTHSRSRQSEDRPGDWPDDPPSPLLRADHV